MGEKRDSFLQSPLFQAAARREASRESLDAAEADEDLGGPPAETEKQREYIRMLEERNRLKQRLSEATASKQQKKAAAREKGGSLRARARVPGAPRA